ncbi:MAG: class I SAM-dependent methyltransferase [Alphaproteobacteria bacterium]|nr:class I SAM-dependent methyltransferase [Alphaproteobacteria bacterium]
MQSLPRIDRAERKVATVSAGADWGNLRYGKGFRAEANLATLQPFLPKNKPIRVLDVGANRGAFALELKSHYPKAQIIGIEPDERVVSAWAGQPGFTWLNARLEQTRLEAEGFDLIYSCHTLEHLKSAREALLAHREALAPKGYLLVEVPNAALLSSNDIVEEFFIDKHLYHFTARTLANLLTRCGFRAIAIADPRDTVNITVVAVKADAIPAQAHADPREVESAIALISSYHAMRLQNLAALSRIARIIDAMAPRKVAVWGAGRLLDSLITNGGLRPQALAAVVDKHLIRYASESHGIRLTSPEDLGRVKPDIVVVMSRSFAAEIRTEAQTRVPGCEVIAYGELLAQAKAQAA